MLNSPSQNPYRRGHRKRISALRLSSDTTSTLPEYGHWQQRSTIDSDSGATPLDLPPDYPDSAEEADEDTDAGDGKREIEGRSHTTWMPQQLQSPPSSTASSPTGRRTRRAPTHRRRQSSPIANDMDPYLDSLLARSVHALEMSNALLQSSMTPHVVNIPASVPTIARQDATPSALELEHPSSSSLMVRRRDSSESRQERWADDLEEISRGVEGLLGNGEQSMLSPPSTSTSHISCSVPMSSSSPLQTRSRRRSSLDLRATSSATSSPQLRLERRERNQLVAAPPRALTQYVASSSAADTIILPSTLGLRSPSSSYLAPTPTLHSSPSISSVVDKPPEPSTQAYNMLSSFLYRHPSASASTSSLMSSHQTITSSSSSPSVFLRRASSTTCSLERGSGKRRYSSPSRTRSSASSIAIPHALSRSRSHTPKPIACTPPRPRPMTPPIEESSSSRSSSSEWSLVSEAPTLEQTVSALRRILVVQPPPKPPEPKPKPSFLVVKQGAAAEASASMATASVSRLFTRGMHTASTRPPSPPRQSSMKGGTPRTPLTPVSPTAGLGEDSASGSGVSPNPTTGLRSGQDSLGVAGLRNAVGNALGNRVQSHPGSQAGSGRSTPKRISFAELPESYAASSGAAGSSGLRKPGDRRSKGRKARSGKGKGKDDGSSANNEGGTKWWLSWLVPMPSSTTERMIERGWGATAANRVYTPATTHASSLEEWGV